MGRLPAIDWAPLAIPMERRLQTMAVMHYVFTFLILPVMCVWVPVYILMTRVWWLMVLYIVWFYYDFDTPKKGSRPTRWYRKSALWRHFANYFPITLVKTAELPPDKNYIIASHPHGVISIGAFTSLCTDATDFSTKFPGISSTLMTLVGQFWFPFRREYSMLTGGVESSRDSLKWLLRNPGRGRAVGIVVGGAAEALDAKPGCYDLNLANRRGFIRFALRFGADLVPMYNFGENDIYHQFPNPRGSKLRSIQVYIKKMFGFTPPLLRGRGIFNYSFGLLPHRTPITSVMGAPISVDRVEDPTEAQVDELHARYCEALSKLFDDHKTKYGVPANAHLHYY
uniref:Acyltransferase n=1 Tax=Plectus sambesii TaxID=2011161 RepID=A0A914UQ54_9BILA